LTVSSGAGLCNRLRVLTSGLALAEASGRDFRVLWPLNDNCAAPFATLFAGDWPVVDVERRDLEALPRQLDWRASGVPDILAERTPHVAVRHNSWLIRPDKYPAHAPLRARCAELLDRLEPAAAVSERIREFRRERFRPEMIGVHLRRGDLLRVRPDVAANTAAALAHVERFLAERPRAGVLLCTDDGAADPVTGQRRHEGVRQVFEGRYGDRLVFTRPRSLDRARPEAAEDAVVDLFLLRGTQMFVGSEGSTFSTLAVFGRDVPAVFCGGALAGYRRFERLTRVTGLHFLLTALGRRRYGDVPFVKFWTWLVAARLPGRYRSPWNRL
jgi:hypothetical protein